MHPSSIRWLLKKMRRLVKKVRKPAVEKALQTGLNCLQGLIPSLTLKKVKTESAVALQKGKEETILSQHANTNMRIVGGRFRGRALQAPKSQDIRPTTDRIRESLFNIISHNYGDNLENARVLDLFAGTGALGIEALSRGARFALFIENSVEGRGLLRQNIENLSLQGHSKVFSP